jgi:hypothetical protein
MTRIYTDWLRAAGAIVPENTQVEISPLFALDAEGVCKRIPKGKHLVPPVVLNERSQNDFYEEKRKPGDKSLTTDFTDEHG